VHRWIERFGIDLEAFRGAAVAETVKPDDS